MHRWSISITVHWDATQSSLFIILQVHSTCFGCPPHPSSGVHKTVSTDSGTGHIFCAATSMQHSQASSATLEAVVTVLCTPDDGCSLVTLQGGSCTKNMTSTEGCSYSFVYSGWWVWLTPETCRVNLQIINRLLCVATRWTVINIYLLNVSIIR